MGHVRDAASPEGVDAARQSTLRKICRYLDPCYPYLRYIYYEVGRACATHAGAYLALCGARGVWAPLDSTWNRTVLSRGVMNVCYLGACGYRGLSMWRDWYGEAGWTSLGEAGAAVHGALTQPADGLRFVPATAAARLYDYDGGFQRLSAVMFGFQFKNLVDTIVFGDGAVFVLHHLITMAVALFALHPYSHLYGSFFFGVSEVSTTVLALLALFDGEFGIPELERDFPTLRLIVGVIFAVSFAVVRCVLWPYFTWFYCRDARAILAADAAGETPVHSRLLVNVFMYGLLTLSVMQAVWFVQICQKIHEEVVGPALVSLGLVAAPKKKKRP